MISSVSQLKSKLPFQNDKRQTILRQKIWKSIEKSIPNYIRLREAKKWLKSVVKIPFRYDQKQQEQQIKAAYDYAKDRFAPNKTSDPKFAQQTVSKNEFKFFLRHLRFYYETLYAWKRVQPSNDDSVSYDKFEKVIKKLKSWNHQYLNKWSSQQLIVELGGKNRVSFKQFLNLVIRQNMKEAQCQKAQQMNEQKQYKQEQMQEQRIQSQNQIKNENTLYIKDSQQKYDRNQNIEYQKQQSQIFDEGKDKQMDQKLQLIVNQQRVQKHINCDQNVEKENKYQDNFINQSNGNQTLSQQILSARVKQKYQLLFDQAKRLFYAKQYSQGRHLINQCIFLQPQNSILHSNKALFSYSLGQMDKVFVQLQKSIQLNPLNYIAYWNIFSILIRQQQKYIEQAYKSLCCALSCLYLLKAKQSKNQIDIAKSVKYAQNNLQAHILKGMMHLQNQKYKLALNQFEWAVQIDNKNKIARNLRNFVYQKVYPQLSVQQQEVEEQNRYYRLQSDCSLQQCENKKKQIKDRVNQFNQLYTELKIRQNTQHFL